jgi:hypothetical protein
MDPECCSHCLRELVEGSLGVESSQNANLDISKSTNNPFVTSFIPNVVIGVRTFIKRPGGELAGFGRVNLCMTQSSTWPRQAPHG